MGRRAAALLLLLIPTSAAPAYAQSAIVLDGSLNGLTDDLTAQPGPNYEIGEALGVQVGSNLFHSFSLFSIATGDSATFTEDPALNAGLPPIGNVIARVTGGVPSAIDGLLRSTIPNADLFLLNPAGVLFGGGSAIDVPGSLTISSAHSLVYAGGTESLSTVVAANPVLSAAAPEAFGFLGGAPAADLEFVNPDPIFPKLLRVPDGETFTAIGGNVRVVGVGNSAQLVASGGRVQVAAVGSAAIEVPVDLASWDVQPASSTQLGEVHLEGASALDASQFDASLPQGQVVIRGGRLTLADRAIVRAGGQIAGDTAVDIAVAEDVSLDGRSELRTETLGGLAGGTLRVSASEISLADQSLVRTRVFDFGGSERGGDISLRAGTVELDRSSIVSSTEGSGAAGNVEIVADQINVVSGSISAVSSTLGPGGEIQIKTGNLSVRGGVAEIVTTNGVTTGNSTAGGDIAIAATGSVAVRDGGLISAESTGSNPGGAVRIGAAVLEVSGEGLDAAGAPRPSSVQSAALASGDGGSVDIVANEVAVRGGIVQAFVASSASGGGGGIDISARRVSLEDGGQISTTSAGTGDSGAIDIAAIDEVSAVGNTVIAGTSTPSGIFSRSLLSGDAGDVRVEAPVIRVENGAEISTRAVTSGNSGDITLAAPQLVRVAGSSVITARGVDGTGGDVLVDTERFEVLDGAVVDVSTSGTGQGGEIHVRAGDVLVAGASSNGQRASLGAQADSSGNAEGITIEASRTVEIGDGGRITALSRGEGGPGSISITAGRIVVGGEVTAESFGGTGGNVSLTSRGDLAIAGGQITVRSGRGGGDAGSIFLSAARVLGRGGIVDANADAFGGNVEITASELVHLAGTQISAVSRGGANAQGLAGGNILIDPPAVVLNRSTLTANGFGNANGGNIFIAGNPLLISADSAITASSQFGTAGTIVFASPNAEVAGELAALPSAFLDASSLLAEACLAREEVSGTFTVRSTGALRPPPDAPLGLDAGRAGEQCEPR